MLCGAIRVVFNRNCFPKIKHFSRLAPAPSTGSHVHRKVAVSKKWCRMDTLLLRTTNRKYHMAYRFVPFPVKLNNPVSNSPVAGLIKCNLTNLCDISHGFNWHGASRGPSEIAKSLVTPPCPCIYFDSYCSFVVLMQILAKLIHCCNHVSSSCSTLQIRFWSQLELENSLNPAISGKITVHDVSI